MGKVLSGHMQEENGGGITMWFIVIAFMCGVGIGVLFMAIIQITKKDENGCD